MLNTKPKLSGDERDEAMAKAEEIAFFPLTMPVTVGAGCMAITITIGSQVIGNPEAIGAAVGGLAVIGFSIFICYRYADVLCNYLGKVGTNVVTKLAAFILLAVGVQIIWTGLLGLVATVPR
jgi:multiple antibiotic resistance protein